MSAATMKERPILFSGAMVRAILGDRKTQTRRVVKPQPTWLPEVKVTTVGGPFAWPLGGLGQQCGAPLPLRFQVGDRLWVRETFFDYDAGEPAPRGLTALDQRVLLEERIEYRATPWTHEFADPEDCGPWKPAIHMPRWASRITLEVTGVRVERVQDISERDAEAEGVQIGQYYAGATEEPTTHGMAFRQLWDSLNAKRGFGWDVNPWVRVIEFRRIEPKVVAA